MERTWLSLSALVAYIHFVQD
jgi:hypothetical protein